MYLIFKLAILAVCGALFAAFLKPLSPVFAIFTSLACGLLLIYAVLDPVKQIFDALSGFLTAVGVSRNLYVPVIKAVGIAVLVHITAQVCRDAGESALGSKLELAGVIAAIAVCIPLMREVFTLLESMLL